MWKTLLLLSMEREQLLRIAGGLSMGQFAQSVTQERTSVCYNGHKRVEALKFQAVVAPNGLIANLYGPVGKLNAIICIVLL